MDWSVKQTWKNCLISTFICLICCSIGTMGTTFYLISFNWMLVLLISISVGLSSSIIFMILWHMLFQQMNFRDSFKSSLKMSVTSMMIMILTENIIILFIAPKLFSHQMHMNSTHSYSTMAVAMLFGFLFSLPYNYYHIQKTGQICH
jgi:membrane protein YdbS with pleckstrin-like domain